VRTNTIVRNGCWSKGASAILTYAQAESILARLHEGAEATQRTTFRARLKNLKKLGIPLGSSPGRGKKITYSRDDLYQWAFCLECAQFGFDPTAVAETVKDAWPYIKACFEQAEGPDDSILMAIDPAFMSKALKQRERFFVDKSIMHVWPEQVGSLIKRGRLKRACVFNLTRIVREIDRLVQRISEEQGT
jgi:hypothetical protein